MVVLLMNEYETKLKIISSTINAKNDKERISKNALVVYCYPFLKRRSSFLPISFKFENS